MLPAHLVIWQLHEECSQGQFTGHRFVSWTLLLYSRVASDTTLAFEDSTWGTRQDSYSMGRPYARDGLLLHHRQARDPRTPSLQLPSYSVFCVLYSQ